MRKGTDMFAYTDYEAIPSTIAAYMMTVADADSIEQVPLTDINDFLNGLENFDIYHSER
jgi:hypothetical protein